MKPCLMAAACLLAAPGLAFAHSGGLDANGCHNNKTKNVYECHQGPLKDQTFKNKAEAEKRLSAQSSTPAKPAQQTAKTPPANQGKGKPSEQTAKVPDQPSGVTQPQKR